MGNVFWALFWTPLTVKNEWLWSYVSFSITPIISRRLIQKGALHDEPILGTKPGPLAWQVKVITTGLPHRDFQQMRELKAHPKRIMLWLLSLVHLFFFSILIKIFNQWIRLNVDMAGGEREAYRRCNKSTTADVVNERNHSFHCLGLEQILTLNASCYKNYTQNHRIGSFCFSHCHSLVTTFFKCFQNIQSLVIILAGNGSLEVFQIKNKIYLNSNWDDAWNVQTFYILMLTFLVVFSSHHNCTVDKEIHFQIWRF